jgi:hypothetical protein
MKQTQKKKHNPKLSHQNKLSDQAMKARESMERKDILKYRIELKRLQSVTSKLRTELEGIEDEPLSENAKMKSIDLQYRLKGGAKPALEYYLQELDKKIPPPPKETKVKYFNDFRGKFSNFPKGEEFIKTLFAHGKLLYEKMDQKRSAIQSFTEILSLDHLDTLVRNPNNIFDI